MRKQVVILYGAPGSGKGTQADLLSHKMNIIHLDSGKFFEGVLHDPKRQKEAVVIRERKLFDTGRLLTPSFVTREIIANVRKIEKADWGIVFSGSPRTMYESERLTPVLEKLYGKQNIHLVLLDVPGSLSLHRNAARLVCGECGYTLLTDFYPKIRKQPPCPVCGGRFYKRSVDNAAIIKIRLKEYEDRTAPIFSYFKKRGYVVHRIDARPAPYLVAKKIMGIMQRDSKKK